MLAISEELKKEITSKGLEYRWISYRHYVENGNFHKHSWAVYKPEKKDSDQGFYLGNNPDGIIRRGDCILAVRPKELCEQHREDLADRANRQKYGHKKAMANELRQMAKDGRLDTKIDEESSDE